MRALVWIVMIVTIAACQSAEEDTHQVSMDFSLGDVNSFLQGVDGLVDNELDVAGLNEMSISIPVDEEKQQKFEVTFHGDKTTVLYHAWREDVDTVHLYFSTPSEKLADAIRAEMESYSVDRE